MLHGRSPHTRKRLPGSDLPAGTGNRDDHTNISFSREHEMQIFYKGEEIGTRRVDFFVEGKIMLELKAIIALEDVHLAQAINYLEAYNMNVGLLVNFGSRSLEFKRVLKSFKRSK